MQTSCGKTFTYSEIGQFRYSTVLCLSSNRRNRGDQPDPNFLWMQECANQLRVSWLLIGAAALLWWENAARWGQMTSTKSTGGELLWRLEQVACTCPEVGFLLVLRKNVLQVGKEEEEEAARCVADSIINSSVRNLKGVTLHPATRFDSKS